MSLAALLLPVDGNPTVVRHGSWSTAAVSKVLGSTSTHGILMDWSPNDRCQLYLLAGGDGGQARNPYAWSLGGPSAMALRGPLLLLSHNKNSRPVGFTPEELLIVATKLLVAEAAAGQLPGGPPRKELP